MIAFVAQDGELWGIQSLTDTGQAHRLAQQGRILAQVLPTAESHIADDKRIRCANRNGDGYFETAT